MLTLRPLLLALTVLPFLAPAASAQIAVSANDAKAALVDGVTSVAPNPPADTVTVLDLGVSPPRVLAEIPVPTSVVGPPESVAIAPDESFALVTAATKLDPADPSKAVPDNRLTVIDLRASPPAVLQTLAAGSGASGVSINPAGTLALVANRIAGIISILQIEGSRVTYTKRDFAAGLKPYSIQMSPTAPLAIVAHVGAGPTGSADVLSIIDLSVDPPRAVEHAAVGPTAEGIAVSHDGKYVAVTVMNGTNAPKGSPLFNPAGRLRVFAIAPRSLTPVAEAPLGRWCQGAAWSRDGRTLLAQCMVEQEIQVFSFDGRALTRTGAIRVGGGPAGIRTADPR